MYLTSSAGFSPVPATVSATLANEGGASTQQDVEDDAEAPQITTFVIEGGLISEHLHYFWSHIFCRATLRRWKFKTQKTQLTLAY